MEKKACCSFYVPNPFQGYLNSHISIASTMNLAHGSIGISTCNPIPYEVLAASFGGKVNESWNNDGGIFL